MGAAARSRPLAEGCSLWSQARPLGCGLFCKEAIAQRLAGRSLGAAKARSSRPAGPLRAVPLQAAARRPWMVIFSF